jgi:hypothetical protein
MKVRRKMGRAGSEELEEGLRRKDISRKSGSPLNDRGGLKKAALSPKPPLAAPSRRGGGVDYFVSPFPRHVKEESGNRRKLRMEMTVPANRRFGVKGMDGGAAWNQLSLRRTAL